MALRQRRIAVLGGLCVAAIVFANGAAASASPHNAEQAAVADKGAATFKQGFSGTVRDEAGKPVAGALVVPRSLERVGPPIPELAILTDGSGRYAWPLRPGSYELVVTAEGHHVAQRRGSVTQGTLTTLDVVLGRKR